MGIGHVLTVLLDLCSAELLQHTMHVHNPLNGDNAQAVSLTLTTRIVVIGHEMCSYQGLVSFSHARPTLLGSIWHTACSDERFGTRQAICSLCIIIYYLKAHAPGFAQLARNPTRPRCFTPRVTSTELPRFIGLGFHTATVLLIVFYEYSSPCVDVSRWRPGGGE